MIIESGSDGDCYNSVSILYLSAFVEKCPFKPDDLVSKIQRIMSRREKAGAGKKGKIRSISSIQPVTKSHKY